jgi:4'-phosphopantetheinyl transferase EntD
VTQRTFCPSILPVNVADLSAAAPAEPPRRSAALAALYPPGVHAAETLGRGDPELLSAREFECVNNCAEKRIRDFAGGRSCARLALLALGVEGFDLLPGERRQPLWPTGVIGSITHTEDYSAAVVGLRRRFRGLGVDTEVVTAVKPELWPQVCVEAEMRHLERLPAARRPLWAALVFAAKEAFYKCQFPATSQWLEFSHIAIEPADPDTAEGSLTLLPQRPLALAAQAPGPWTARYRLHHPFVTVGMALPT